MITEIDEKEATWGFVSLDIPAEVFFNKNLSKTEMMLFSLIRNISQTSKGCWASNRWLGDFLDCSIRTISDGISNLAEQGYINIHITNKPGSTQETERHIYVDNNYIHKYRWLVEDVNSTFFSATPLAKNNIPPSEKLLPPTRRFATDRVSKDFKEKDSIPEPCGSGDDIENPSVKKETRYIPFAEQLASIIKQKLNIKTTPAKIRSWAIPIMRMHTSDNVPIKDIQIALSWYADHIGEKYTPVIECGTSFRSKYIKLKSAIDRGKPETATQTPTEQTKPNRRRGNWAGCYPHGE